MTNTDKAISEIRNLITEGMKKSLRLDNKPPAYSTIERLRQDISSLRDHDMTHYTGTDAEGFADDIERVIDINTELLEALEEIACDHWDGKINNALKAIAKAKGES